MANRTRTKGVYYPPLGDGNYTVEIQGPWKDPKFPNFIRNSATSSFFHGSRSMTDTAETISDVIGNAGGSNNVSHVKRDFLVSGMSGGSFKLRNPGGPSGSCEITFDCTPIPNIADQYRGVHLTVPDGSALAFARIPGFGKELMSGLNSIYELKDLADSLRRIPVHLIWAAYRGKLAEGSKAADEWVSSIKDLLKDPLGLFKSIVGLDLAWKFGWKPFIGDVQTVMSVLGSVDQKLLDLSKHSFKVHGKYSDSVEQFDTVTQVMPETLGYLKHDLHVRLTTRKTWTAGIERTLSPAVFQSPGRAKLAAIREFLGLSLDATDLWEATPYSFVVDWFLPVNEFVEQFVNKQPDSSWFVDIQHSLSVKTETRGTVGCHTRVAFTDFQEVSGDPVYSEGVFKNVSYTRSYDGSIPATSLYIPSIRMPKLGQWWTGLELAVQRIVSGHKKP